MNAATKLKRSDNVTFQTVADEAILIRLDTGAYFSLNKVGTQFWEMLDGQTSIGEHAQALANQNNRIVQSAIDGLNDVADRLLAEHQARAQTLIDDVRAYARTLIAKYHVDTSIVVSDLLELAGKMSADRLVEPV